MTREEREALARSICPSDPIDLGIVEALDALRRGGVECYESCEGGNGHAYPRPTVRFHGTEAAGWHALGVAISYRLRVRSLRRVWTIAPDGPDGPTWEMEFREPSC